MSKKFLIAAVFLFAAIFPAAAYADSAYVSNMKHNLGRGFKNILTSPLEIPITMQEYHESAGKPYLRQMVGFLDGTFQMLTRAGSGVWDIVIASWIPGAQEGFQQNPEILF